MLLQGTYYEASIQHIDVKAQRLKVCGAVVRQGVPEAACVSQDACHPSCCMQACFPAHAGLQQHCFELSYDILIHSVGSINNDFGIKARSL